MIKRFRKLCIVFTSVLALLLTGCAQLQAVLPFGGGDDDTAPTGGTPTQVSTPTVGVNEDDISFGLQHSDTPDFQDVDGSSSSGFVPSAGPDVNPGLTLTGTVGPMYTEIDGYAYLLDPATLQPTGGPLDRITHEPVVLSDVTAAPEGSEESDGDVSSQGSPSAVVPTDDTKYPNTGIFLEDD